MFAGRLILPLAMIGLFPLAASAHGVWIAERWGEAGIVYGHGAEDGAYDPSKVKSLEAIDESGGKLASSIRVEGRKAYAEVAETTAFLLVEFDNGIWSKAPDGMWVNKPKNEVPGASEAGDNRKYNLSIHHFHGEALPELPAQPLQILPLVNPSELPSGTLIKVRVLFEGKPLTGAEIIPDYVNASQSKLGTTDADGVAEVVIRNEGLNVVAVSHSVALADTTKADQVSHFATLSFVNGHHED